MKAILIALMLTLLAALALAQGPTVQQGAAGTLGVFSQIFNMLIGILVTLAVVVFFWGLIKYLWSVGEQKSSGLSTMVWGVVTIFVMVSIWGLVHLLQNTFGVGGYGPPKIPDPPKVPGYQVTTGASQI